MALPRLYWKDETELLQGALQTWATGRNAEEAVVVKTVVLFLQLYSVRMRVPLRFWGPWFGSAQFKTICRRCC